MQDPTNSNSTEAPEATGITPDSQVSELEKKAKDWEQKYVYLYAEFENFKKRSIKERQETLKFGWENVASGLLEVLDNFDRALGYVKPDTDSALVSGLKMVSQQFKSTLEKQGVAEIQSLDQPFNPELHESVGGASKRLHPARTTAPAQQGSHLGRKTRQLNLVTIDKHGNIPIKKL